MLRHRIRKIASVLNVFFRTRFNRMYRLLYFCVHSFFYGRIFLTDYVSPRSHIDGLGQIFFGGHCVVNHGVTIMCGKKVFGKSVHLNPGVCIYGEVKIGDNVMISPNASIVAGQHGIELCDTPMLYQTCTFKGGITIEDDVWIGANAVILDGVVVGRGAVIGAGAVVTKSVERFAIVVGNPAKILRFRTKAK